VTFGSQFGLLYVLADMARSGWIAKTLPAQRKHCVPLQGLRIILRYDRSTNSVVSSISDRGHA
jgi:hypothetical protein